MMGHEPETFYYIKMFLKTVLALLFIIKLRKVPDNLPNFMTNMLINSASRQLAVLHRNLLQDSLLQLLHNLLQIIVISNLRIRSPKAAF